MLAKIKSKVGGKRSACCLIFDETSSYCNKNKESIEVHNEMLKKEIQSPSRNRTHDLSVTLWMSNCR